MILSGVVCILLSAPILADETARAILDRAKRLEDGERRWGDRTQRMILETKAAGGQERHRELQVFTKRYADDEEKTLSFLLASPEVAGTGFLQWTHRGRDDEQWLYLPEFRRTRQITARLRDESFVGTDFTYRDLEILGKILRWSEHEATTRRLDDTNVGGASCYAIEMRPQAEGMPYARIHIALDRDRLLLRQLDFFAADGSSVKELVLGDIRDIGRFPTAHRIILRHLKKGSQTTVQVEDPQFDTGLRDELFTQRYLERGAP